MANDHLKPEPMALPIPEAVRISGLSRSELYRQMAKGNIVAVKRGCRTLIVTESLKAYLAALPRATFRAPAEKPAA